MAAIPGFFRILLILPLLALPLLALPLLALPLLSYGQHDMHNMPGMSKPASPPAPAPDTTRQLPAPVDHSKMNHGGMDMDHSRMPGMGAADTAMHHDGMAGMGMESMSHAYSRNLPMGRNGSGTAWNPDQTPMYMWMSHHAKWMVMNHGAVYLRYSNQNVGRSGSQRGGRTFDAPNWFMSMAQRNVGEKGLLNLTAMFSVDALTDSPNGYPLLFQSGEAYQGKPLVDRQHPHDLFSALSIGYTHSFSQDLDLTLYLGYPGEPAIGPVAFMHRVSAMPNADAPLGHHWQDATHITFGVATLGLRYRQFRLEGSNFTGREPDEHRFNFDKPRADSWAGRLSWNPTPALALQVSRAFIKSPEQLFPEEDVKRNTASVIHSTQWGDGRYATSAVVWGMNTHITGGVNGESSHSLLAETNVQLGRPAVFGRYEFVQKSDEELQLPARDFPPYHSLYNVHALTLGTTYLLTQLAKTDLTLGVQGTIYRPDQLLRPFYGRTPISAEVYLRLNPSRMLMGSIKM